MKDKQATTTIRIYVGTYKKVRQKLMGDGITVTGFLQQVFNLYLDGKIKLKGNE